MANWQPRAGATLLMPSGSAGNHLFVVLNDPKAFPGYGGNPHVVLVNLSTVPANLKHDATCEVQPGCHPFVKSPSYAFYRGARIEPVAHIVNLVRQGVFRPQDPMPPEILAAIRNGLKNSPFAKQEFKFLAI